MATETPSCRRNAVSRRGVASLPLKRVVGSGLGWRVDATTVPKYRLMVKVMAPDERPRQRLKLRGPHALSDGDLLAIFLNTGVFGTC